MSDLVAFLLARLADEERIAQGAARTDDGLGGHWAPAAIAAKWLHADARVDDHVACHDPARVLREVAAKRKVIARYGQQSANLGEQLQLGQEQMGLLYALEQLASAYADHPDYDPSWRSWFQH